MQTRLFLMLTFAISVMVTLQRRGRRRPGSHQSTSTVPTTTVQSTTTTPTVTFETTTSVASATTVIEEPEGVTFVGNWEGVSQEAAEAAAGTPLGSLTEDEYEDAGIVHRCFWSGPQGDVAVIVSSAKGDFADEVASLTTGCEGGAVEGLAMRPLAMCVNCRQK